MNLDSISALILTHNEEANIDRTLGPLRWINRIVVLDSFSTDRTLELVRMYPNVELKQRAFDTHAAQWNFGLQQITTEWVLTLDADYQLSDQIVDEIQRLNPREDISGYNARFQYRIYGRPLRASVYPPRIVFFRRDRGSYYDDGHTQRLKLDGKVEQLSGLIFHDDRKSVSHWLNAQDRYALLEARHLTALPWNRLTFQDRLRRRFFFAAPVMFLFLLFGRGLIFDGWPGWFYVAQRTIAELMLSLRLLIQARNPDRQT